MSSFQFLLKRNDFIKVSLYRNPGDRLSVETDFVENTAIRFIVLPYRLLHTDPVYILCQLLDAHHDAPNHISYVFQVVNIYTETKGQLEQVFLPMRGKKVKLISTPLKFNHYWLTRHLHHNMLTGQYFAVQITPMRHYAPSPTLHYF
jgi:hypothetical protein